MPKKAAAKKKVAKKVGIAGTAGEISVEYMPLDGVKRWPRNPKDHDIPAIIKSMKRWGFTLPIMRDASSGQLVAGHGRLEALLVMQAESAEPPSRVKVDSKGRWFVPVLEGIGFDNEDEAEAYLIADNRLTTIGGWFDQDLAEMLIGLEEKGANLYDGLGFDEESLRETIAAGTNFDDFLTPNVELPEGVSPKTGSAKDGNWFYVEFYGDDALYAKLKEQLKSAMGLGKMINSEPFVEMVELWIATQKAEECQKDES